MSDPQNDKDFPIFASSRPQRGKKKEPHVSSEPAAKASMDATASAVLSDSDLILAEIKSVGSRLDTMDGRLNTIASSISSMESAITNLTQRVQQTESRLNVAENRISAGEDANDKQAAILASLTATVGQLQAKVDDLENRGRRKNLKIIGLPERAEGSTPLVQFLQEMLPSWVGLPQDFHSLDIERAHRSLAPAPASGSPPRSVLVRFLRFPDREAVLRAAAKKREMSFQGSRLRFYADLSSEVLRKRRTFDAVLKRMVQRNMFRGFAYPARLRCVHEGQIRLFEDPKSALAFLESLGPE